MRARNLKYGTLVIGNEDPRLCYDNPFFEPNLATPAEFIRNPPLGDAATLLLHAFGLVDHDFPFPYIRNLHPWYRWPMSILNYAFLAVSMYGMLLAIRRFVRRRRVDRETFASVAILIMSISYLAVYVSCDVENRFSLPLVLLWSPFLVTGLLRLRQVLACRRFPTAARFGFSVALFIGCCVSLSSWMQRRRHVCAMQPDFQRVSQVKRPPNWTPFALSTIALAQALLLLLGMRPFSVSEKNVQ